MADSLDQVVEAAGATLEILPEPVEFQAFLQKTGTKIRFALKEVLGCAFADGRRIYVSANMKDHLDRQQRALHAKLEIKKGG